MKWKEFKEVTEKEIKLIRPNIDIDELEIARIDICNPDKHELRIGTYQNNELVITDF